MKDHIEELKWALSVVSGVDLRAALQAAIELMRAAEPKDEAAEREHCLRVAHDVITARDDDEWMVIARERAAARGEGAASEREVQDARYARMVSQATEAVTRLATLEGTGVAANRQLVINELSTMLEELRVKLTAAEAEVERLSTEVDVLRFDVEKEVERARKAREERDAARAELGRVDKARAEAFESAMHYRWENENLRGSFKSLDRVLDKTKAKLTNLRAVADQAVMSVSDDNIRRRLLTAIEASR